MLQWRERLHHFLFHLLYIFHLLLVLLGLVRSLSRIKRWVLWLQRISVHPEGKASWSLAGQAQFQILEKWGADSYSGQRRSCMTSIPNQKETAGGKSKTRMWGSAGAQEDFQNLPLRARDAWSGGDWMLSKTANWGCTVGMGVGKGSQVWFHQILPNPMLDLGLSSLCLHTESLAHFSGRSYFQSR